MSAKVMLGNESILDLKGVPLQKDYAQLLKALDHLMTVGTYYSPEHEQYLLASRQACANIVESMGSRPAFTIEIGSEGMMLGGQTIETGRREIRQIHDLLVPLNIARLEITRGLQPDHLRTALHVLREQRMLLGARQGFREVRIEGLPPTVRTLGCRLLSCDQAAASGDLESASLEDLACKFLSLVGEIIANLKFGPAAGDTGNAGSPEFGLAGSPRPEDFETLAKDLKALAQVESDPHNLLRLIQHAQQALDLSRDPTSVDLVFRLLRKELRTDKPRSPAPDLPSLATANQHDEIVSHLRRNLASVRSAAVEAGAMDLADNRGDFLGICFQVLQSNPSPSLTVHLCAALEISLSSPDLGMDEIRLCASWVAAAFRLNRPPVEERILGAVLKPLRASRMDLLPPFWLEFWSVMGPEGAGRAWPYLVNDILMGTGPTPSQTNAHLLEAVGSLSPEAVLANRDRLFGMTAFQNKKATMTIFALPPSSLSAFHRVMLESPLAIWHGTHLRRILIHRDPTSLPATVLRLLGDFKVEQGPLVAGLLERNNSGALSCDLKETVLLILKEGILTLPRERRTEDWVVHALTELARLDAVVAEPILTRVLNEKRLFFFHAWPQECRTAAERMVLAWSNASVI